MRLIPYVIFILFSVTSRAATPTSLDDLKRVIRHYKTVGVVTADVEKNVFLALLDEKKSSQGTFVFSQGQMRLEFTSPEKSLIILNKKYAWVVSDIPSDQGTKVQALKIKAKDKNIVQAPIVTLMSKPEAWEQFKILKDEKKEGAIHLRLVPKKAGAFGDLAAIDIQLDPKKKIVTELAYKDELDNETKFRFSKTQFETPKTKVSFDYQPPKGVEVTEY